MVYDKLHDSSHPNTQRVDELYKKVVQGMKALERFYILHEYGLSDDYKYLIYDNLNDNCKEYINAFNKMGIKMWQIVQIHITHPHHILQNNNLKNNFLYILYI